MYTRDESNQLYSVNFFKLNAMCIHLTYKGFSYNLVTALYDRLRPLFYSLPVIILRTKPPCRWWTSFYSHKLYFAQQQVCRCAFRFMLQVCKHLGVGKGRIKNQQTSGWCLVKPHPMHVPDQLRRLPHPYTGSGSAVDGGNGYLYRH